MGKEFFIFCEKNKFGFKSIDKNTVIKNIYDDVKEFENHLTWVKNDGSWTLIDVSLKNLIKEKYDNVLFFNSVFSVVKKDKIFYLIENNSQKTHKIKYEFLSFNENIMLVKDENKYFYLNEKLEKISNDRFDDASIFVGGFAPVCKNSKWGIINKNGYLIIDFIYDKIFQNGVNLFKANNNHKTFFIDLHNNVYLSNLSSKIETFDFFSNELLVIKKGKKYGVMNEFFEIIFLKNIDYLYPYTDDISIYKKNDKYGLINKRGRLLTGNIFDKVFWKTEEYFYVIKDGIHNYYSTDLKKMLY